MDRTAEQRFFSKLVETPGPLHTPCWVWTGVVNEDGRGRFHFKGRTVIVHRWCWEFFNGPLPPSLVVDHLCMVKLCCNPEHLDPVTGKVNSARWFAAQTHCKWGHPLSGPDAILRPAQTAKPNERPCAVCARDRNQAYRNRQRAKLSVS